MVDLFNIVKNGKTFGQLSQFVLPSANKTKNLNHQIIKSFFYFLPYLLLYMNTNSQSNLTKETSTNISVDSSKNLPLVAIVMGSDSDYGVMEQAEIILKQFEISYSISIVSAHRTPDRLVDFAKNCLKNGYKCVIAGAGGSAHLPGMVASMTTVPVIGVPVITKTLSGLDSLYSIVQMPGGIPVATVAINGGKNAGLLAVQMLSMNDQDLSLKIQNYRDSLRDEVLTKSMNIFGN